MKSPRLTSIKWPAALTRSEVAAFFLFALTFLAGCATPKRTNLWPLYYSEKDPEQRSSRTELLWPLLEFDRSPELEQAGLRPLANHRRELRAEEGEAVGQAASKLAVRAIETQALYPLFESRCEPLGGNERTWLFPLYYFKRAATEKGDRRLRVVVPLLRVSGRDPEKGDFAATPLYGNIYDILGYERIHVVAFPFYVRTIAGKRDSVNVVFPFFSHTVAPGYSYWRAWPLAGYASQDGQSAHGFFLWPFINYRVERPGTDREAKTFMLFPLFGFSDSPTIQTRTVLWPFFSHQQSKTSAEREEWNVPTPFARYHRSRRVWHVSIWPVYGETERDNYRSYYVLWPLYRHITARQGTGSVEEYSTWPFYRDRRVAAPDGRLRERSVRFWPLAAYRGDDQTARLNLLSLWPAEHQEGIERNWSVFWTLLRYERNDKGDRRVRVLGRLVEIERATDGGAFSLGPIVHAKKTAAGRMLSLLGGLLEFGSSDGRRVGRILFIPLRFSGKNDGTMRSSDFPAVSQERQVQ